MARLTTSDPGGDTAHVIEDKVRALPANQGLNDWDMWQRVDTEIAQAIAATNYRAVGSFTTGNNGNSHGNK